MKIVLDTNVLVSAFVSRGVCSQLLEHCGEYHQLITSEFILVEFHEKLIHKLKYDATIAGDVRDLLQSQMVVVIPADLEASVSRDADDDVILGTAIAGDADCIITGDKDLLILQSFSTVAIIRPSDFADYEAAKSSPDERTE